ncbi:hypothetical protein E2C06_27440 [Dankookia rubra]|uniref:Uncharacterized protein n=1 Tax=Dankookia rubra TaxID=1442381 RepID=A0A4V3A9L1_9PROT|nr:hypothetical protein [Dankookia rubra]TDH59405.1 hypothetical protein E2C06_27440 [Dankookia rubra]
MERRATLLEAIALPLLASCRSVDAEQTTTLSAVVETVDPASRELLLRGGGGAQSGDPLSMVVSPRVQRPQPGTAGRRGDPALLPGARGPGRHPVFAQQPAFRKCLGGQARDGQAGPGGEVTRVRRCRVTVTAVDSATNSICFIGPDNVPRNVIAQKPEVQAFIRRLRPGNELGSVYEEALAISVEPMT